MRLAAKCNAFSIPSHCNGYPNADAKKASDVVFGSLFASSWYQDVPVCAGCVCKHHMRMVCIADVATAYWYLSGMYNAGKYYTYHIVKPCFSMRIWWWLRHVEVPDVKKWCFETSFFLVLWVDCSMGIVCCFVKYYHGICALLWFCLSQSYVLNRHVASVTAIHFTIHQSIFYGI